MVVIELDAHATFPGGEGGVLYCTRTARFVPFAGRPASVTCLETMERME